MALSKGISVVTQKLEEMILEEMILKMVILALNRCVKNPFSLKKIQKFLKSTVHQDSDML